MIERTKERIIDNGEVFTPPSITNDILDKIKKEMWEPDKTFLDPTSGDGNMLVEILKRKLSHGHSPTQALSTIYGIDIMRDNVLESRRRMLEIAGDTPEHQKIVNRNIQKGNALTFDWSRFDDDPLLSW